MAAARTSFTVSRCLYEVRQVDSGNRLNLFQTIPSQTITSRFLRHEHFATTRKQQSSTIFAGIPDYGLPKYGISQVPSPAQPKPSGISEIAEAPLVTKFWDYGTPRPYNTPSRFVMVLFSLSPSFLSPLFCRTTSHLLV